MATLTRQRNILKILGVSIFLFSLLLGGVVGSLLALQSESYSQKAIWKRQPALPSRVLDVNGNLITEFFSDEKREIISIDDIPSHLIFAFTLREDKSFFEHRGFSLRGTLRAVYQQVLYGFFSGGSSITQQYAGVAFARRTDISIGRKLKELWWTLMVEREMSKKEIMVEYLNYVPLGHTAYGVEAASYFFFGHSVKELSPAESAILSIQLVAPGRYSPFRNPEGARNRSKEILDLMVDGNFITKSKAEQSFHDFWDVRYKWTSTSTDNLYLSRQDRAPYFSEYVRNRFNDIFGESRDLYKDGYTIYTTLNLDHQNSADILIGEALQRWNSTYRANISSRVSYSTDKVLPLIEAFGLLFNQPGMRPGGSVERAQATEAYIHTVNPVIDIFSQMFNIDSLAPVVAEGYRLRQEDLVKNSVETALITLDNRTGYVVSMIGGSQFSGSNQFNRAMNSKVMPGSSFKPIVYSVALSEHLIAPGTYIYDKPTQFLNYDETYYSPRNFNGVYYGPVSVRQALSRSINIPAVKVLEMVGVDAVIERSAAMMGIESEREIKSSFPRHLSLALGIGAVSPYQMARAFSLFPRGGRPVEPILIRYIEDREGNTILNPEETAIGKMAAAEPIMGPAEAYAMVNMLESSTHGGTLNRARVHVGGQFSQPTAGKTGTTQNWADGWVAGFSPYYTTVIWIGFDKPGNSLGVNQTGATAVGPVWGEYMEAIQKGLAPAKFDVPDEGFFYATVCSQSGMIPNDDCPRTISELFLPGTEPTEVCDIHPVEVPFSIYTPYIPDAALTIPNGSSSDSDLFSPLLDLDSDTARNIEAGSLEAPRLESNDEFVSIIGREEISVLE